MQARVMHHVCLCLLSLFQPLTFRTLPLWKIVSRWQTDCFWCGLPAGSDVLGSSYVFWGAESGGDAVPPCISSGGSDFYLWCCLPNFSALVATLVALRPWEEHRDLELFFCQVTLKL